MTISIYSTTTDNNSSKTVSIPVTVTGNNRHMLMIMSTAMNYPEEPVVTSMQYNGADLTFLTSAGTTSAWVGTHIYSLSNPDLGTHNLTATFTWSIYCTGHKQMTIITYGGVDQVNPIGNITTYYYWNFTSDTTLNLDTSQIGSLITDATTTKNTSSIVTPKSGQSLIYETQFSTYSKQTISSKLVTNSSTSVGYTIAPAASYDSECAVVLNPYIPANKFRTRNIRTTGRIKFGHKV